MRKFFKAIMLSALPCLALLPVVGCKTETNSIAEINRITDIERFSDMQKRADKIDVKFDNDSGGYFYFTVENENDVNEIMNLIFDEKLTDLGTIPPPIGNTSFTVCQGEKKYSLSVHYNVENDRNYSFSNDLNDKIVALAAAQGAYDSEVGVIYKIIDLKDGASLKEEKVNAADKAALLSLIESDYGDCDYFFLCDDYESGETHVRGIAQDGKDANRYKDTVTAGKGKLLVMWRIYRKHLETSYYLTSPTVGEYVDNGNSSFMEFTFGQWHPHNFKLSVVS